jgi:WD40 repeat protein
VQVIPRAFGPLSFAPDGKKLATASREGIVLWSLDNPDRLLLPDSTNVFGFFANNHSLTFSPDGRHVLSARNTLSERGVFIINIWDTQTGELTYMPDHPDHVEHTGAISALAFSPDGNTLATASADHSIRLWDFAKRERVSILQGHLNEVKALAFSRDGRQLISGAKDGAIHIWPVHQESTQEVLPGTWSPVGFGKDGRRFAAFNREGLLGFFDSKTRELLQEFPIEQRRFGPPRYALSGNGHVLAQPLGDGQVRLWQTETRRSTDIKLTDGPLEVVALSPDGSILITSGARWSLRWWELSEVPRERKVSIEGWVQFSPDGRTLAIFQRDGIQLMEVATATVRTNIALENGSGIGAFSPDGRFIATSEGFGDTEYAIRVWETTTAKLVGVFAGHKQSIASIAFSPDGKTLASSSDDSTLKFWNISTEQELLNIRRLGGPVRDLNFSPGGEMLIGRNLGTLCFFHAPL